MKLNAYIINDYLKVPIINHRLTSPYTFHPLSFINFLESDIQIQTNTLYITSLETLQNNITHIHFGCFLCIGFDTSLSLPEKGDFIFINAKTSITTLLEAVQSVFNQFNCWEKQLYNALASNAELKKFAELSIDFFENALCLYTTDSYCLFSTERKKNHTRTVFHHSRGTAYLSDFEYARLKNHAIWRQSLSKKTVEIFPDDVWGYRILYKNIFLPNQLEIYSIRLMALEVERPIRPSDYLLLDILSHFIERAFLNKNILINYHSVSFTTLIDLLLKKEPLQENFLSTTLDEKKWKKNHAYLCGVLSPESHKHPALVILMGILPRIEHRFLHCITFDTKHNAFLVIWNMTLTPYTQNDIIKRLLPLLQEANMNIVFSRIYHDFTKLPDYYEQAKNVLFLKKYCPQNKRYYLFDDYALICLLHHSTADNILETYFPEGLSELMSYDKLHHSHLTQTLYIYLKNERKIHSTIHQLSIQRSTFNYRLKRIQDISHLDLDNYHLRMTLLILFEKIFLNKYDSIDK